MPPKRWKQEDKSVMFSKIILLVAIMITGWKQISHFHYHVSWKEAIFTVKENNERGEIKGFEKLTLISECTWTSISTVLSSNISSYSEMFWWQTIQNLMQNRPDVTQSRAFLVRTKAFHNWMSFSLLVLLSCNISVHMMGIIQALGTEFSQAEKKSQN